MVILKLKLDELNDVIDLTLRSRQYECHGDRMVVKGVILKSSDARPSECSAQLKRIFMYASNTFYVDSELHLNDMKELKIYAPKWIVNQQTAFHLNGLNGSPHPTLQQLSTAGRPGNVGKNAGNFFGLAIDVINGNWLSVHLNGGIGSNGQDSTGGNDASYEHHEHIYDLSQYNHDYNYFQGRGYKVESISHSRGGENWEVFSRDSRVHTFRIHASQCCGNTGLGGVGM